MENPYCSCKLTSMKQNSCWSMSVQPTLVECHLLRGQTPADETQWTAHLSLKRGAERWAKRGGLKRECRVKTDLSAAEPQQQPQPDERRRAEQQLRAVGADCSAVRAEGT